MDCQTHIFTLTSSGTKAAACAKRRLEEQPEVLPFIRRGRGFHTAEQAGAVLREIAGNLAVCKTVVLPYDDVMKSFFRFTHVARVLDEQNNLLSRLSRSACQCGLAFLMIISQHIDASPGPIVTNMGEVSVPLVTSQNADLNTFLK